MSSLVALESLLEHLDPFLEDEGVSELSINKPGEMWVEKRGDVKRVELPVLSRDFLRRLAGLVAGATHQKITEKTPLLSATLPKGHRVQFVLPPACPADRVIVSIRRQAVMDLSLADYEDSGFFDGAPKDGDGQADNETLAELKRAGRYPEFFKEAVRAKKTLLISGGCSTGKTTFLNMLLSLMSDKERIITIEDAQEVRLKQPNHVSLLYSRNDQGVSNVSPQMLVETSLRLRPDRILMSELRGEEAYYFLRAANTGHEGSMSTLHADSPGMALKQLSFMCMQSGLPINHAELLEYISTVLDVVAQIKQDHTGRRYLSDVWFRKDGEWIK